MARLIRTTVAARNSSCEQLASPTGFQFLSRTSACLHTPLHRSPVLRSAPAPVQQGLFIHVYLSRRGRGRLPGLGAMSLVLRPQDGERLSLELRFPDGLLIQLLAVSAAPSSSPNMLLISAATSVPPFAASAGKNPRRFFASLRSLFLNSWHSFLLKTNSLKPPSPPGYKFVFNKNS